MFDTLRFADRLKRSGFDTRQAEGLARAIGDAMTTPLRHVVTNSDLDAAIGNIRSDLAGMDARPGAKFDGLSGKFDALSAKFDALAAQFRFITAMLVVLLILRLVDTVPRILG